MSLLWSQSAEYKFPKPEKQEKRKRTISEQHKARMREEVFTDQNEKCFNCARKFQSLPEMDLHHKSHSKMGGGSRDWRRENLEGLCRPCHKAEHPGLQWGSCQNG